MTDNQRNDAPPNPGDESDAEPSADDRVGYCRPPKHTRFRKGQSGNPRGRPNGALNLNTLVRTMMTEKVAVRTDAGIIKMTKIEVLLRKMLSRAGKGDWRAEAQLLNLYSLAVPGQSPEDDIADAREAAARRLQKMAFQFLDVEKGLQGSDDEP